MCVFVKRGDGGRGGGERGMAAWEEIDEYVGGWVLVVGGGVGGGIGAEGDCVCGNTALCGCNALCLSLAVVVEPFATAFWCLLRPIVMFCAAQTR